MLLPLVHLLASAALSGPAPAAPAPSSTDLSSAHRIVSLVDYMAADYPMALTVVQVTNPAEHAEHLSLAAGGRSRNRRAGGARRHRQLEDPACARPSAARPGARAAHPGAGGARARQRGLTGASRGAGQSFPAADLSARATAARRRKGVVRARLRRLSWGHGRRRRGRRSAARAAADRVRRRRRTARAFALSRLQHHQLRHTRHRDALLRRSAQRGRPLAARVLGDGDAPRRDRRRGRGCGVRARPRRGDAARPRGRERCRAPRQRRAARGSTRARARARSPSPGASRRSARRARRSTSRAGWSAMPLPRQPPGSASRRCAMRSMPTCSAWNRPRGSCAASTRG